MSDCVMCQVDLEELDGPQQLVVMAHRVRDSLNLVPQPGSTYSQPCSSCGSPVMLAPAAACLVPAARAVVCMRCAHEHHHHAHETASGASRR